MKLGHNTLTTIAAITAAVVLSAAVLYPVIFVLPKSSPSSTHTYKYVNGVCVKVEVFVDFDQIENKGWFYMGSEYPELIESSIGDWSRYLPENLEPKEATIAADEVRANLRWLEQEHPVIVKTSGYIHQPKAPSDGGIDIGISPRGAATIEGIEVGPSLLDD